MDAGMVTAICTGVAAIIAAASPVVIELLRQRSKRWAEKAQRNPPVDERSPGARASVARLGPPGSDLRLHRVVRSASTGPPHRDRPGVPLEQPLAQLGHRSELDSNLCP
jgi:hypothetical protein